MTLARLTAEPEYYVLAERALERAFALAPDVPPRLHAARLHIALHRPRAARVELEALEAKPQPLETRKARAFRLAIDAQVSHALGEYGRAAALIRASLETEDTATGWAVHARDLWLRAQFDEALSAFERAEALYGPHRAESRAWVKLQIGVMFMERGRLADAEQAYREADQLFPGYWLVREHLAEVLRLRGYRIAARALYEDVVRQVDVPELHTALSDLCHELGDASCARREALAARRTRARWRALFPTMVDGHDIRRRLEAGEDAVELARENVAVRPNAESWILLAHAELVSGDLVAARRSLGRALDMPVRSAETHELAAAVFGALGDHDRARMHADHAVELDPTRRTRLAEPG